MMKEIELQKRLAQNLKWLRKEKKLTQFELAELADISEMTVKKIETGKQWPSEKTLVQISNALKVDACNLFLPCQISNAFEQKLQKKITAILLEEFKTLVKNSAEKIGGAVGKSAACKK